MVAKDRRSKKVVFLSYCLINQNSKVEGFAKYPAMIPRLINLLKKYKIGIHQIPCPEVEEFGIGRPVGEDTKQQYDTESYRRTCSKISENMIKRILDYQKNNYKVLFILGVDGSPSCGINISPVKKEDKIILSKEKGIFFEVLLEMMKEKNMNIEIIGIPETEEIGPLKKTLRKIEKILRK